MARVAIVHCQYVALHMTTSFMNVGKEAIFHHS